jgi:hypothetical protein
MNSMSRRAFIGAMTLGGLPGVSFGRGAFASSQQDLRAVPGQLSVDYASALNLQIFLEGKAAFDLVGLVSMRPVESEAGKYPFGSLFLFPFKRNVSSPDIQAFFPGQNGRRPLRSIPAITSLGIPTDEYLCNYVVKMPAESFISFAAEPPFTNGAENRPWHTNVGNIASRNGAGDAIGVSWTSANLNHLWFENSRWIPDTRQANGLLWRSRIIAALRHASAMTHLT